MGKVNKIKCEDCGWKGIDKEMLTATSPFDSTFTIIGCPECKRVDTMVIVCEEEGCWQSWACGMPTKNGYKSTCGEHKPK